MTTGTVTGKLTIDLSVKMPTALGVRAWIAVRLCGLAALVLGGRLRVMVEPSMTTQFNYDDPSVAKLWEEHND